MVLLKRLNELLSVKTTQMTCLDIQKYIIGIHKFKINCVPNTKGKYIWRHLCLKIYAICNGSQGFADVFFFLY